MCRSCDRWALLCEEEANAMLDELAANWTMVYTLGAIIAELVATEQCCVYDIGAADATNAARERGC